MTRLRPVGAEIWTAEGPSVSFYGFPYPTRMAVIRLTDGRLLIWSPILLESDLKSEIEALGETAYLVSPNKLHHLYLAQWRDAFPAASLWAPPAYGRRQPMGAARPGAQAARSFFPGNPEGRSAVAKSG